MGLRTAWAAGPLLLISFWGHGCAWQDWSEPYSPGPRDGHSLHLLNGKVYLFGGRGNNVMRRHAPTTFEIVDVNGTLEFATYDTKMVIDCPAGKTEEECYNIEVGLLHNDIWQYDLDCHRFSDKPCTYRDWKVLDGGKRLGGCNITFGLQDCTHPTERYDHGSALFDDGTLFIFGGFSRECGDFCSDQWMFNVTACEHNATECRWEELGLLGREGPGRRWRYAQAQSGDDLFLFGGHRLWHGFASENTAENAWNDTERYPYGGYLDDLWRFNVKERKWTQILPREACYANAGPTWDDRRDIICTITWPARRASSRMVLFEGELFLHGGYSSFFPYPQLDGRGSSIGTGRSQSEGPAPFIRLPQYLEDFWVFNFDTGLWREITPVAAGGKPAARRDHVLFAAGDAFVLTGGYGPNQFFRDFWLYNTTTNRWLEKLTHVHARYPDNCTSDVLQLSDGSERPFSHSVQGQPTRGTLLDGLDGRLSEDLFVPQPRRRRPGWDGCRDRRDNRTDLFEGTRFAGLQWEEPNQRYGAAAIYSDRHESAVLYGGVATVQDENPVTTFSPDTIVRGDFWYYNIHSCPHNCSDHGSCFYGYCFCDEGFYGLDCSNVSCPGDYCFYDKHTHAQVCKHCCHASYNHSDGETYKLEERKVACDADHAGESHGICNGFGTCQCAPPFITSDCSVRDCPNDCSGNGWCSVEYPVSRCMCDPGYTGLDCSSRLCLNNCTYPNGNCLSATGVCNCSVILNPYNRSVVWAKFGGEDCSFMTPFAGASSAGLSPHALAALALASIFSVLVVGDWALPAADRWRNAA